MTPPPESATALHGTTGQKGYLPGNLAMAILRAWRLVARVVVAALILGECDGFVGRATLPSRAGLRDRFRPARPASRRQRSQKELRCLTPIPRYVLERFSCQCRARFRLGSRMLAEVSKHEHPCGRIPPPPPPPTVLLVMLNRGGTLRSCVIPPTPRLKNVSLNPWENLYGKAFLQSGPCSARRKYHS